MNRITDTEYMSMAYRLAEKGLPFVSPNPAVGAIIVKDGRILGLGYHRKAGSAHAEIEAIKSCKGSIDGATMYVTLEPCVHYGKTPPCVEAILRSKIKRVVIGAVDPNPLVNGKGIRYLKKNGVEVSFIDNCEEGISFNCGFEKWIRRKLPFVILKIAMSMDGRIADKYGDSKYLTSLKTREFVHRLRYFSDAILVGAGTVVKDDPQLNSRLIRGGDKKRITRVVLDGRLSLNPNYKVFADDGATRILITSESVFEKKKVKVRQFEHKGVMVVPLKSNGTKVETLQVLEYLGSMSILYLLVEGGGLVFTDFLRSYTVDNLVFAVAPSLIGNDGKGFFVDNRRVKDSWTMFKLADAIPIGGDIILHYYKEGSDVYRLDRICRAGS